VVVGSSRRLRPNTMNRMMLNRCRPVLHTFVCYGFLAVTGVCGADLTGVCGAESMIEMFCFSILLSMICIAMASTHRSRADVDDFGADGVDGVGDADGCVDLFVGG